ncbi:MAG: hypothetical protein IH944_00160 [Armatimonadetes bacterium]|nr:hypothetical protein [Armatimonadota bacterium]
MAFDYVFLIPIIAIVMGGFIAVAVIVTGHHRKMAVLVRKEQPDSEVLNELRALRGEIAELRDRVNQQTLALEEPIENRPRRPETPPDIPQRLTE